MNWNDILEDFLADQFNWKAQTRAWYRRRLMAFVRYVREQGIHHPADVELRHIKRHFADLQAQERSWSTRNGGFTALQLFFRWLRETGIIPINIFAEASLKRPPKPRSVHRTLQLAHIKQMIAAAEADVSPVGLRDAAIMRVLLSTGVRRAELAAMTLADLDLSVGEILVRGKFDNERYVFLDEATVNAIRGWLVVRPASEYDNVFVITRAGHRPAGHPLQPNAINQRLTHWKKVAGIPKHVSVSPHKWRHTFATQYNENGGDVFSLRDLLGHTDVKTTEIYVKVSRKSLRRKIKLYGPKLNEAKE